MGKKWGYRNKLKTIVLLVVASTIFASCVDELNGVVPSPEQEPPVVPVAAVVQEPTKLGKQLKNPYSVKNMQRALDTMLEQIRSASTEKALSFKQTAKEVTIKTTDLYVRFLPKDSSEMYTLEQDTNLILYERPLDHKITKKGDYYHDPSLSDEQITWQYTVVKPDYKFPSIQHDILAELFIPDHSENYDKGENTRNLKKLETVSLYLTDNLSEEEKKRIVPQASPTSDTNRIYLRRCIWFICWEESDWWTPRGYVKIDDTERGVIPVQGLRVEASRWFKTRTTYTNSRGYFRLGSRDFQRKVDYRVVFETYKFTVREQGFLFFQRTAIVQAIGRRSSWNLILNRRTPSWFKATIFMAAYHYYHQYIKGLKRPPSPSFWHPKVALMANFKNNDKDNGNHSSFNIFSIFSNINIYNPYLPSDYIYGTTIHELAHASHWDLRRHRGWDDRTRNPLIVLESWASGVEWALTRMRYPNYKPYYSRLRYTGVVQDMIDGYEDDQLSSNYWVSSSNPWANFKRSYNDYVSGYTIKQIEDVLINTSSWEEWKNNIKNKYNNATENNLDAAFRHWNTK